MGLILGVGWLAEEKRSQEEEEFESRKEGFEQLNKVLVEAGRPRHHEPLDLATSWEAQMWGYGGLHTARRLAAHYALDGRLAPPLTDEEQATDDPLLRQLYTLVDEPDAAPAHGWLPSLTKRPKPRPRFSHLVMHSDCEGFYVPQDFARVIFDLATPQRPWLGGMVGSSLRLQSECEFLAALIELPGDLDPESDDLWETAESRQSDGPLWRQYGVEAFTLARLIHGARLSVSLGAVLAFG